MKKKINVFALICLLVTKQPVEGDLVQFYFSLAYNHYYYLLSAY